MLNNISVKNMISPRGNEVPNQFIINIGNKVIFQSYNTPIGCWDMEKQELNLSHDWEYSRTTMKYFKQFINEYTSLTYYNAKDWRKLLEDGYGIGIFGDKVVINIID